MCPQRRPVQRSRETLTCAPGERRGGRGEGAELEAAHLAGQVSPARARGGANQGGTGVERPPRLRPNVRGSRGRFHRCHPPTSGVRGPGPARERPERAPGLGGQTGVRGPCSPLGLRWLGVGAVLAGEAGAGGERGPCTP